MSSLMKKKTAVFVTAECYAKFTFGMLKDIQEVSRLCFPLILLIPSCSFFLTVLIRLLHLRNVDN